MAWPRASQLLKALCTGVFKNSKPPLKGVDVRKTEIGGVPDGHYFN